MAMFNVKSAIRPKVGKHSCYARHLIVLYTCVKFRENISDGISAGERNGQVLMWLSRVILMFMLHFIAAQVDVLATQCKIFMCLQNKSNLNTLKLSVKYSHFSTQLFVRTNEQMDTQNFGGYNIIPSPLFVTGHKST